MEKQLIISIGREYGSAGHEIAQKLAEKLDIELFDRNLLDEISQIKSSSYEDLTGCVSSGFSLLLSSLFHNGIENSSIVTSINWK